jgi:hypothetical protein
MSNYATTKHRQGIAAGIIAVIAFAAMYAVAPEPPATKAASAYAPQRSVPQQYTPVGPINVRSATIGCISFEDHMSVVASKIDHEVDVQGLLNARRCLTLPVGTTVEIVERMKRPDGLYANPTCVKPAGARNSNCVWMLMQNLDIGSN